MKKTVLSVKNVQKKYDEKTVLNDISLNLRQGEFLSVVGPSGCGKSTLLRLVLGWEAPTSGEVLIDDRPAGPPDRRRGIIFQNYTIFPNLTALENIVIGPALDRTSPLLRRLIPWRYHHLRKQWLDEAREMLDRLGMSEHAKKYPHQLSGGQRQRIAIAQTLITKPSIILMDEPFSGLDPGTRDDMQVWMHELQKTDDAPTILFVTHDIDEAVYLGTRLIVLSQQHTDGHGARIVVDISTPRDRQDPNFIACQDAILAIGFDKERYSDRSQFLLSHPDAIDHSRKA